MAQIFLLLCIRGQGAGLRQLEASLRRRPSAFVKSAGFRAFGKSLTS